MPRKVCLVNNYFNEEILHPEINERTTGNKGNLGCSYINYLFKM